MMVTGSLNDPRVNYWEPAKFVAKMRAVKTDSRMLVLKVRNHAAMKTCSLCLVACRFHTIVDAFGIVS